MDSIDGYIADQVFKVQIQVRLVTVKFGSAFEMEPVYLPGFVAMNR